eukprot:Pompholyxophrys_punicea_v1_NODE_336_length_2213_cov_3.439759.p3 type:complete len:111 gc:universal NODE_336_length_2213_cov_3.439759:1371-1703(+)
MYGVQSASLNEIYADVLQGWMMSTCMVCECVCCPRVSAVPVSIVLQMSAEKNAILTRKYLPELISALVLKKCVSIVTLGIAIFHTKSVSILSPQFCIHMGYRTESLEKLF